MKGIILNVSESELLIRGDDNHKYGTTLSEVNSDVKPRVSDEVDFDIIDGKVSQVYVLRSSATLDETVEKAKESATQAFNKLKDNIDEESIEKAKEVASQTKDKAVKAAKQTAEKLKSIDYSKASSALKSVDVGILKDTNINGLHNKFSFFVVIALFISMILPAVKIPFMGTVSYFNAVENSTWSVIFLTATAAALALGLPRLVSRITGGIALIFICTPIYDAISGTTELYGRNKGFFDSIFDKRVVKAMLEQLQIGAPLMAMTLILFIIVLLLPKYQLNQKFISNNVYQAEE